MTPRIRLSLDDAFALADACFPDRAAADPHIARWVFGWGRPGWAR